MATMTIDIINPTITLMSRLKTNGGACATVFEFTIKGTPNGQLKVGIARIGGTIEDYDSAEINVAGQWELSAFPTQTHTLNSVGQANFKLVIGNSDLVVTKNGIGSCNETKITLTDLSSGVLESQNFSRCRAGSHCTPTTPPPAPSPTINETTNIVIYFDKSGSMDSTLAPLQTMRDTLLKDALLPYYNNDESVYYNKVKVIEVASMSAAAYEDPYGMLNYEDRNLTGKVISLAFIDEANIFALPGMVITDPPTINHTNSLSTFRSRLNGFPSNYYKGVLFQVATPDQGGGQMIAFRDYMEAVKNGTGSYSGTNGLSDRTEVNIKLDIAPADTPAYYKDLIISSLNELGYTL